jgi:lipopolysaccharide/colanic/teichoic acid biosynthesis glycosyltransferase
MSATGPKRELSPVTTTGDEVPSPLDERDHRSRSSWPTTRLTGAVMTLLVGVAVAVPDAAHDLGSALFPALLLPALLATLAARLMFETIDGAAGHRFPRVHILGALGGSALSAVIMWAAILILGLPASLPVELISLGVGALALIGTGVVRDVEIRVRLSLRRVYFAGSAESLRELQRELRRSPEASLAGAASVRSASSAQALMDAVTHARATVLVLDREAAASAVVVAAATAVSASGTGVRELLTYYESEFKKVPLTELTPAWFLFEREDGPRTVITDSGRRAVTTLAAAAMLIVSLPLLIVLATAVRLTSAGPAIFRQTRVGRNGSHFTLLKLRTMTVVEPGIHRESSAVWAADHADRITPLGRLLRRYRLDELPQLWNVLLGELALIGPRPEQVPIVERLEREIPFYAVRHSVRPGLTGWAQVNLGYSGSLRGAREKLQRDLYYVKHRGTRLDMLILWLTLKAVFTDPR